MRIVVQRVKSASVTVDGAVVGRIGRGLLLLVGVHAADTPESAEWLSVKCANLRIFEDEAGKMNRSLLEVQGAALAVSQFTLFGDARKGNRPSFIEAAPPDKGRHRQLRQRAGIRYSTAWRLAALVYDHKSRRAMGRGYPRLHHHPQHSDRLQHLVNGGHPAYQRRDYRELYAAGNINGIDRQGGAALSLVNTITSMATASERSTPAAGAVS